DRGCRLVDAEFGAMGRDVDRNCERLVGGEDGRLFAPEVPAGPRLPRWFRVRVTDRQRRCPTLVLEAVPPPEPDGVPGTPETPPAESPPPVPVPGRWQAEFLAELAELLAATPAGAVHSPLDF